MTVMEHCELGKEVASLDEYADGRASKQSLITEDAIVDTYQCSSPETVLARSRRQEYLPQISARQPQEDTDVSSIRSKERSSRKREVCAPVAASCYTDFTEVPHSSHHFEQGLAARAHFSEPRFEVHNNHGAVYNFDGTHNLQIGRRPTMVVNVYGESHTRSSRKEKKKYIITNSRKMLDDENITMLSERLGRHWTSLARKLGFHSGDIDRIEYDNRTHGLKEVIFRMLFEWREKKYLDATMKTLADALIELKLYDIAQSLKG